MKIFPPLAATSILEECLATPKLGKLFESNFKTAGSSIEKLCYLCCMLGSQSENCINQLQHFLVNGKRYTIWSEIAYARGIGVLIMKKWSQKDLQFLKSVVLVRLAEMSKGSITRKLKTVMDRAAAQRKLDQIVERYRND